MKEEILARDFEIIKKPIITEKSTRLSKDGKYIFEVSKKATKTEIKRAIERIYQVKVEKVNILKRPGKKRILRRKEGKTPDTKRAIVTLAPGQKIEVI
jgi:large subunit ribosomal protein L23